MLKATRRNLTEHWKRDTLSAIPDWDAKMGKYAAMTKLTISITDV